MLDKTTGQNVVLSEQDVDIIERFRKGKFVDATYDPYEVGGKLMPENRVICQYNAVLWTPKKAS